MRRVSGVSPGYPHPVEREVDKARIYRHSLLVANSLVTWSGTWKKMIEILWIRWYKESARRYI